MWWLLSQVPLWLWVVGLVLALAATVQFWGPIWAVLPRWLHVMLAGVGAIVAAYFVGRNRGYSDAREREKRAELQAMRNREEINKQVDNLDRPAVDKRLDKWLRD